MSDSVVFSKLIEEYGTADSDDEGDEAKQAIADRKETRRNNTKREGTTSKAQTAPEDDESVKKGPTDAALMQTEERKTGAVTWSVYTSYMKSAGGLYWGPCIFVLLVLAQGASGEFCIFLPLTAI